MITNGLQAFSVHNFHYFNIQDNPCYPNVECESIEASVPAFMCGECPFDMTGDGIFCEVGI